MLLADCTDFLFCTDEDEEFETPAVRSNEKHYISWEKDDISWGKIKCVQY